MIRFIFGFKTRRSTEDLTTDCGQPSIMVSASISTSVILCLVFAVAANGQMGSLEHEMIVNEELGSTLKLFEHCDDCKKVVKKISKLVTNLTESGVDFFDLPLPCGLVDGDFDICNTVIEDAEEIVELDGSMAEKICENVGFCKPTPQPFKATTQPPKKKTTPHKSNLYDDYTDDEDANMYFVGSFNPAGKMRKSRLRASKAVDSRHVRNSAGSNAQSLKKNSAPGSPIMDETNFLKLSSYFQEKKKSINPEAVVDTYCFACKKIMRQSLKLTRNLNKNEIKLKLPQVCKTFRFKMQDFCRNLMNQKPAAVTEMLWDREPALVICDNMKQCRFTFCNACNALTNGFQKNEQITSEIACSYLTELAKRACIASVNEKKETVQKLVLEMKKEGQKPDFINNKVCFTMEYCPRPDDSS